MSVPSALLPPPLSSLPPLPPRLCCCSFLCGFCGGASCTAGCVARDAAVLPRERACVRVCVCARVCVRACCPDATAVLPCCPDAPLLCCPVAPLPCCPDASPVRCANLTNGGHGPPSLICCHAAVQPRCQPRCCAAVLPCCCAACCRAAPLPCCPAACPGEMRQSHRWRPWPPLANLLPLPYCPAASPAAVLLCYPTLLLPCCPAACCRAARLPAPVRCANLTKEAIHLPCSPLCPCSSELLQRNKCLFSVK